MTEKINFTSETIDIGMVTTNDQEMLEGAVGFLLKFLWLNL